MILLKYFVNLRPLFGSCVKKAWAERLKHEAFSSKVFFFLPKEFGAVLRSLMVAKSIRNLSNFIEKEF